MSELLDYDTKDMPAGFTLSANEKDAIGEIGNICMGTAATTLSTLLGNKVSITTPRISIGQIGQEMDGREEQFVSVEVSYVQGVEGSSVLLIKERDVMAITSILMGEQYDDNTKIELDELHFSAISEVMNQMMGSSATALSSIVKQQVNISPPALSRVSVDEYEENHSESMINIRFTMEIENVLKSEIIQIMPFDFGKKLASCLLTEVMGAQQSAKTPPKEDAGDHIQPAQPQQRPSARPPRAPEQETNRIGVRSVQYQPFDAITGQGSKETAESRESINFIMDVPLQVTVELGQCKKTIKEILGFNMGSVIVLDKLAGEMVDIFVNGKLFARGEVVVIDDNYGVRVTDILSEPKI